MHRSPRYLRWLVGAFDYHEDPWYARAAAAADLIVEKRNSFSAEERALLGRVAWETFREAQQNRESLLSRLGSVAMTSAAAILAITYMKFLAREPLPFFAQLSATFFFVAQSVGVLSRRATNVLKLPRVTWLVEHFNNEALERKFHTAIAVYNASLGLQSNCNFLAQSLNVATWLEVIGVAALIPLLF